MHFPREVRFTIITVPLHVAVRHQAPTEPYIVISVETLRHTIHDSYGIFGVTFLTNTLHYFTSANCIVTRYSLTAIIFETILAADSSFWLALPTMINPRTFWFSSASFSLTHPI